MYVEYVYIYIYVNMCVYWSDFAFVMQKNLTGGLPRHPFQQGTILVEKI